MVLNGFPVDRLEGKRETGLGLAVMPQFLGSREQPLAAGGGLSLSKTICSTIVLSQGRDAAPYLYWIQHRLE